MKSETSLQRPKTAFEGKSEELNKILRVVYDIETDKNYLLQLNGTLL